LVLRYNYCYMSVNPFLNLAWGAGLGALVAALGYSFIPWDGKLRRCIRKHAFLILWVAVIFFALLWWAKGATRYWALTTSLADEGVFTSQLWNALQGRLNGTGIYQGSYYLVHFAPSLNILALFYAPWQNAVWLYGLRAMGAASGALGFFYIMRELGMSRNSGLLFAFIWMGNIAVRGALCCEFHEVALVAGLFTWVVLLALRKQYVWCLLIALVLMGFKEDIPVYVGGLGVIIALSFRRPLAGWLIAALAIVYYIAVTTVVWNLVIPSHWDYFANKFPQFNSPNKSALTMVLANPLALFTPVLGWDRLWGLIVFFLPVLFLPFIRWGWLGLVLPLWLVLGMEGYNDLFFAGYYGMPVAVLITICAIPGFKVIYEKQKKVPKLLCWAIVGLAIGSNFVQNPEINYYQFDIYGMMPHPYLHTVERMAAETPADLTLSADVYSGSHYVNRKTICVIPDNENWLSDRLYISNRMIDNPLVLLAIGELGYGEVISHPGFFFLEHNGGMDAREDFLNRLRWMEAEATGWPLWTTIKDHRASSGIAEFIPSLAAYGDRARLTPRLLLPPGDYHYQMRLATRNNPDNPFAFVFEVNFIRRDGTREILTSKVTSSGLWGKIARYETVDIPFTVTDWGLTFLSINFGSEPNVWWDGVGLTGLPSTFDKYFHRIFPQTLAPASGCLDNSQLRDEEGTQGKVLKISKDSCSKVICRWQVDPSLPEGDYWIYYANDSFGRKPLDAFWSTLEKIRYVDGREIRQSLGPLYVRRKECHEDDRIERFINPVHLEPGAYLELRVNPVILGDIVLRKMWICHNVITDNVFFFE
jgi:uncharacterized membrane protein